MRSSLYGITGMSWRGIKHSCIGVSSLDFVLSRFRTQCFAARRTYKVNPDPLLVKEVNPRPSFLEEKDAFYVVRKGDVIGIYRSLCDCQAQVSSSVHDPSVGVYKGYSLSKETEVYLATQGLKKALYSLNVRDAEKDMFGTLLPCPFTQPEGAAIASWEEQSYETTDSESTEEMDDSQPDGADAQLPEIMDTQEGFSEIDDNSLPDEVVLPRNESSRISDSKKKSTKMVDNSMTYILEFDGASKGNPGKAGAGAVLRTEDGTVLWHIREGLGTTTNNVAEYRAVIMGMQYALEKGFQRIRVQGDSLLVCKQVNGLWKTKDPNMATLCKEVKGLRKKFVSFKISHVLRDKNSAADAQANIAVDLPIGQVSVEAVEA